MKTPTRTFIAAPRIDARNTDYPMRGVVTTQTPVRKLWAAGPPLNQGSVPACFGFAWAAELIAEPQGDRDVSVSLGNKFGLNLYRRAMLVGNPGAVAAARGLIDGYLWAANMTDVRDAIIGTGPVILTVPWFMSMGSTRPDGLIRVNPNSGEYGYHATMLRGYDPAAKLSDGKTGPAFLIRNSWSKQWGKNGDGWFRSNDLKLLIELDPARGYQNAVCLPFGRHPVDVAAQLAAHPDPNVS